MSFLRSAGSAGHGVDHVDHPRQSESGRASAWHDALAYARTVEHDAVSLAKSLTHFLEGTPAHKAAPSETSTILELNRDFPKFDTAAEGGKPDGFVSTKDLKAVSKDPNATPQMRDAADYLLAHPKLLTALDTSAEGDKPDGKISRDDLTSFAIRNGDAPALTVKPLHVDISTANGCANQNPTILHINAQAPSGASWGNPRGGKNGPNNGNYAGIVSVYVDGHYAGDATILKENPDGVDVNLGVLSNGHHTITLRDTSAIGTHSPGGVTHVQASTRQLNVNAPNETERNQALAAANAPVVRLYNNGQAVDNVPLLTSAQVKPNGNGTTTITYQVLFSNEDGGDGAHAGYETDLWGRDTDDQTVYTVTVNDSTGKVIDFKTPDTTSGSVPAALKAAGLPHSKTMPEGANNVQTTADGRPEVAIVTTDNEFGWPSAHPDQSQTRIFSGAPVVTQTNNSISLMNAHPWTWNVSTEEMKSEDQLGDGKPYNRLYLNLVNPGRQTGGHHTTFKDATSIDITLKDGTVLQLHKYHSGTTVLNIGDNRLNSSNNVSVVLPQGVNPADVTHVQVCGLPAGAQVQAQWLDPNGNRPVLIGPPEA